MVRSKYARKQQMQGCTPCNVTSTPNIAQNFRNFNPYKVLGEARPTAIYDGCILLPHCSKRGARGREIWSLWKHSFFASQQISWIIKTEGQLCQSSMSYVKLWSVKCWLKSHSYSSGFAILHHSVVMLVSLCILRNCIPGQYVRKF